MVKNVYKKLFYRIVIVMGAILYFSFAFLFDNFLNFSDPMPFYHRILGAVLFLFVFFLSFINEKIKDNIEDATYILFFLAILQMLFLNYQQNFQFQMSISIILTVAVVNLLFRFNRLYIVINLFVAILIPVTYWLLEDRELSFWSYYISYILVISVTLFASYYRDKIEAEIKRVKDNFERMINQSPGIIYQVKLSSDGEFKFIYGSKDIFAIFGVDFGKISDKKDEIFRRIHREDYEKFMESIRESANDLQVWHQEFRIDIPEKGIIWAEANARPKKQEDGSIIWFGNMREITRRKEKDEKLKLTEYSLHNASVAIFWITPEGVIDNANKKACEMLGYNRESLIGKRVSDIDADHPPKDREYFWEELKKNKTEKLESRLKTKQGNLIIAGVIRHYLSYGDKEYEFVFADNISERKEAENKLRETKERLDREIRKAKNLHEKSLPTNIPKIEGLNIYAYYQPANEIGGDFYNFIKLGDNKLLFYLIDITGHGLDAALMSSFVKNTINTYIELMPEDKNISPKEIIEFLYEQNQSENFPEDYFITMLLGIIDSKDNTLIYSSAGLHIPPVICDNGIKELPAGKLPISKMISKDIINYRDVKINITNGSNLFISTDGLFEQSKNGDKYGDRYKEIICQNKNLPPGAIVEEINREFADFSKGDLNDDITYALIQLNQKEESVELSFEINSSKDEVDRAKNKVGNFLSAKSEDIKPDDINIAFHEMLINALEHGNDFDESKKIKVTVKLKDDFVQISVKDEGEGFNWMQVKEEKSGTIFDIQDDVAARGRGLGFMMARTVSDYLYYNYEGNEVIFIKRY